MKVRNKMASVISMYAAINQSIDFEIQYKINWHRKVSLLLDSGLTYKYLFAESVTSQAQ